MPRWIDIVKGFHGWLQRGLIYMFGTGGDVPTNPTSGVIPWNNAGTFDDSNLLRRDTSTTDLRYLVTGTVAQKFRIYKTADNGISSPTNFERIVIDADTTNNLFRIHTEAGGTGTQRPINLGQASGANAVPIGINVAPSGFVANAILQIGWTQSSPTDDVGIYMSGVSGQTANYISAVDPDLAAVVFAVDPNGSVILGASSSIDGQLQFRNDSNSNITSIFPGAAPTSSVQIRLPSDDPAANEVLMVTSFAGQVATLEWATPSGTGANTALSNLASVAINTTLLPGTDEAIDLGSTTGPKRFRKIVLSNSTNPVIDVGSGTFLVSELGSGNVNFNVIGQDVIRFDGSPRVRIGPSILGFGSDFTGLGQDVALRWATNQVVRVTDGQTGLGALIGGKRIVPRTSTTNPALADSGTVYSNEGATASVTFNLPTAATGLTYTFIVQDADGLSVVANTGDTIRLAGSVSASAGNIASTTIGSTVVLVAINATEWIGIAIVGTWIVT